MRSVEKIGGVLLLAVALVAAPALAAEKPGDKLVDIFKQDIAPKVSLVPPDITVAEEFQPGDGEPIGKVQAVAGRALVIHAEQKVAYVLDKGLPVFTNDTLIAEEQSGVRAKFDDGSLITLGAYTKMVLDEAVYQPEKSVRRSMLRLLFGKARFIVTKFAGIRNAQFQVKTATAICGVRGSDFAIAAVPAYPGDPASPMATTVMTGENTTVGFAGTVGPEQLVGPMSASQAIQGLPAIAPLAISKYLTAPFLLGGMTQTALYAAAGIGLAGGGAAIASGSSGSNGGTSGPTVAASLPAGTNFATLPSLPAFIDFTFSKPMDLNAPVSVDIDNTSEWSKVEFGWFVEVGYVYSVELDVVIGASPPAPVTLTLVGFKDTDGNALTGTTNFQYVYTPLP